MCTYTAACLQWGWCLTPTAIDVYVCSMLTTAERVRVVWTSSLVAGHLGTTDAQHSTCRLPPCHQCVTEQTSTTYRLLEGPSSSQHQPNATHPATTRCSMLYEEALYTLHSTSTVLQGRVGQELIFFWPPLAQPLRHCSMPPLRVWLTHVYDRVVTPRVGAPGPSAYVTGPGKWSC